MLLLVGIGCIAAPTPTAPTSPSGSSPAGSTGATGATGDTGGTVGTPGEWVVTLSNGEPVVGCTQNGFQRDVDVAAAGDLLVVTATSYDGDQNRVVVRAFDTSGVARWETEWGGGEDCAAPEDLAIGPDGTIYVVGGAMAGGSSDGFVLALDAAGAVLWSAQEGPPQGGRFEYVAVLDDGTIVASGLWTDVYAQAWVAGFDPTGALAWSVQREPVPPNSVTAHGLGRNVAGDGVVATFRWNDWVAPPPEMVASVDSAGTWVDLGLLPELAPTWGWTGGGWLVAPELEQPVAPWAQPYELRAWDTTGTVMWSRTFGADLPRYEGAHDSLVPLTGDAFGVVMQVVRSDEPPARDIALLEFDVSGATTWSRELDLHPEEVEHGRAAVIGPDGAWYVVGSALGQDAAGATVDETVLARVVP